MTQRENIMKKHCTIFIATLVLTCSCYAQGNIDWEELWVLPHPSSTNGPFGWMAGQRQYTGLAYDKWRDVVYIVNPAICQLGQSAWTCPKIWILDAMTGKIKASLGRGLDGNGGQLPVPPDTIQGFPNLGWPNQSWGSFVQGIYPIYKIDLDDEGRIFAGNLVSPIWGTCYPGPPPNCDPIYLNQGPYRVFRWVTPSSTPLCVYVTRDSTQNSIGSAESSEMPYQRIGDAFEVVGKRVAIPRDPTRYADSVRIYVGGGKFTGQTQPSSSISLIAADPSANPPHNGQNLPLPYRVAKNVMSEVTLEVAGITATGISLHDDIWVKGPNILASLIPSSSTPVPPLRTLSDDPVEGTGKAGPIAAFTLTARWTYYPGSPPTPPSTKNFLICADGIPSNPSDPQAPNDNTRARIINVNSPDSIYRNPTPHLGSKTLHNNSGVSNYISDVDYKIEINQSNGSFHVILFVLMSNNGIAAYRSRLPSYLPTSVSIDEHASGVEFLPMTTAIGSSPTVSFSLKAGGKVSIRLYSLLGEYLATLVDGWMHEGVHHVPVARSLPSGVYVAVAQTVDATATLRFVVVK